MADMRNIAGTLLPTFKFRPSGGIELISAAVMNESGNEVISKFKVKDSSGIHEVAYYDAVVQSKDIESMRYTGETVIIKTKYVDLEGKPIEFVIPRKINSNDITILEGDDDEVAVYGTDADGKKVLRPGLTVTNDLGDPYSEEEIGEPKPGKKEIPTSKAVRKYIDDTAKPLKARLEGDDVKIFDDVNPNI